MTTALILYLAGVLFVWIGGFIVRNVEPRARWTTKAAAMVLWPVVAPIVLGLIVVGWLMEHQKKATRFGTVAAVIAALAMFANALFLLATLPWSSCSFIDGFSSVPSASGQISLAFKWAVGSWAIGGLLMCAVRRPPAKKATSGHGDHNPEGMLR